ncbi:MAG: ATP-grasp domain-containing protein [Thermodesulfobacteriota bacterium]
MILSFHPCIDADIQMILGDRALDSSHLKAIEKAKAVILPQACTQDLYKASIRCAAHVFPCYEARIQYPGKVGQHGLFEKFALRSPRTWCWQGARHFEQTCLPSGPFPHDFPFVIKQDLTHEGEGVFFIEDQAHLNEALNHLRAQERSGPSAFISQDYVPCGGNALRAVIVGKEIITYWKRPETPKEVITTISRGAKVDHEWQPELQQKGMVQARILSEKTGINLAAVDFVFPLGAGDPEPLFLEINYYFGRRGLGGTQTYYELLYAAMRDWLEESGLDPDRVRLV